MELAENCWVWWVSLEPYSIEGSLTGPFNAAHIQELPSYISFRMLYQHQKSTGKTIRSLLRHLMLSIAV